MLLMFSSCRKDVSELKTIEPNPLSSEQKLLENRKYLETNFKQLLKTLAPALKNTAFNSFLKSELNKKFDGEFHFLFSEILKHPEFSNLVDFSKLSAVLNKFKSLEGNNLYPQLYAPNFNQIPASISNNNENLEYVMFVGDEGQTTAPSYFLNEDGDPVPTGITVTEQYAAENQIYIVSINESVDEDGNFDPLPQDPPPPGVTTINVRIKDIRIYENKESWLAGDSEVHIKTLLTYWNGRTNGLFNNPIKTIASLRSVSSNSDNKGFEIVKATRSDITSGLGYISNARNYPLETGWRVADYSSDPIAYIYCIFEYDKWPAEIKTNFTRVPRNDAYEDFTTYFRSSNSPYGGGNVPQNSSNNAIANNPYVNYAIFGNGSGLPADLNQQLFYQRYVVTTAGEQFKNGIFFNLEGY